MYIASVGARFIVKRMPDTGMVHPPLAPSTCRPRCTALSACHGGQLVDQRASGECRQQRPPADPGADAAAPRTDQTRLAGQERRLVHRRPRHRGAAAGLRERPTEAAD